MLELQLRVVWPLEQPRLEVHKQKLGSGKVLDVGCGKGAFSFRLARMLGDEFTVRGVDVEARNIEQATRELPVDLKGRVAFEEGNA